jgi:RNA polymerase-binding transcription factor DksA
VDHEYAASEPADLPGGLYDDAVVTEDTTGRLDDPAVAGLDRAFEAGFALEAGLDPDDGAALDEGAELDIDGSLLDTIEQELADVERALALLDEGTYGQCEHCNGAIDDEVLAATPTARYCAEHLPLSLR